MDIYMINTGSNYALYYNPPEEEQKKISRKNYCTDLSIMIKDNEGAWAGLTSKEFRISSGIQDGIDEAYGELAESIKKLSRKMGTKTSGILHRAASEKNVNLNYAHTLEEEDARGNLSAIVKKDRIKGNIILGAGAMVFVASMITPLFLVPALSIVSGLVVKYQFGLRKNLKKGLKDISFIPNPDVTRLEQIIAGEKWLGLTNPDLIEYRTAKGL